MLPNSKKSRKEMGEFLLTGLISGLMQSDKWAKREVPYLLKDEKDKLIKEHSHLDKLIKVAMEKIDIYDTTVYVLGEISDSDDFLKVAADVGNRLYAEKPNEELYLETLYSMKKYILNRHKEGKAVGVEKKVEGSVLQELDASAKKTVGAIDLMIAEHIEEYDLEPIESKEETKTPVKFDMVVVDKPKTKKEKKVNDLMQKIIAKKDTALFKKKIKLFNKFEVKYIKEQLAKK